MNCHLYEFRTARYYCDECDIYYRRTWGWDIIEDWEWMDEIKCQQKINEDGM